MADGLTIRVETPFVVTGEAEQETTNSSAPKTTNKLASDAAAIAGVQIAKKIGFSMTGRIGTYTGSYLAQKRANSVISAASTIMSFAVNPYMGAAMLAINAAFSIYDEIAGNQTINAQAEYIREINGIKSVNEIKKGV